MAVNDKAGISATGSDSGQAFKLADQGCKRLLSHRGMEVAETLSVSYARAKGGVRCDLLVRGKARATDGDLS